MGSRLVILHMEDTLSGDLATISSNYLTLGETSKALVSKFPDINISKYRK